METDYSGVGLDRFYCIWIWRTNVPDKLKKVIIALFHFSFKIQDFTHTVSISLLTDYINIKINSFLMKYTLHLFLGSIAYKGGVNMGKLCHSAIQIHDTCELIIWRTCISIPDSPGVVLPGMSRSPPGWPRGPCRLGFPPEPSDRPVWRTGKFHSPRSWHSP